MPLYLPGKVVVLFGTCPCTIRLPAAPRHEQLKLLRERIIVLSNNLVEEGLWEEHLSEAELDAVMSDVEIEPLLFPSFLNASSLWRVLDAVVQKIYGSLKINVLNTWKN
ncbi:MULTISPECIES: hypothetical protein [unclassified Tolypothrix]|uniref:hypothetical protein n=1 Tax=unclassified Tolypothrix TaxID=2649714 RepID=UPI0005EAB731|nr:MULTISPECIES: hypothetical protein [unclassified Tolypothrix]BAY94564.1 hypothetical protein NIES3275_66160 [Microchaete diplosiphon NIES-3275]EKE99233.1 hypothetical protein FDUTEX481_03426 [Tolypothrix sp. PCC 7601]MBE9084681.1 hypothetical protein [Tolypothrix sp. LEGE 11397]UYD28266.1 hypothetical protein HGR01_09650 [Tolypothrix sp. PCC 7712]UYD35858.1 hypothetical protein HG267_08935 [Tolypothrix sp. PCC 7601]